MRTKILSTLLMSFLSGTLYAQSVDSEIRVGDVFTIGVADNNNYKHINFPRPNFIIKKGGIANYKNIIGKKIEIISIKEEKEGSKIATIRLTSKHSFFNSHKYLDVHIEEAIANKELIQI
jgi:hypothetical protein